MNVAKSAIRSFLNTNGLILIALIILYIISRTLFIFHFTLFFDEAIYIHWGQYVDDSSSKLFISLYDGKQPLLIWLISLSLRLITDPLIAGRTISVIAGIFGLIGIYKIGKSEFNLKTGYLAAFFYTIIPFFLIHDSLALMDGLLCALSIWSTYFVLKTIKSGQYRNAIVAGILIGLGLLTKSSANFFLLLIPLGILILPVYSQKNIIKFILNILVILIISKVIESILRFSSNYDIIAQKNSVFFKSLPDFFYHPFSLVSVNFNNILNWLSGYLSPAIWIIGILSIVFIPKRLFLYYFLSTIIPLTIMIFFGLQMYPRHLLFMTWPILILAAISVITFLERVGHQKILFITSLFVLSLITLVPLRTDFILLTDWMNAPIPQIDRWQLITGRPAGIGMNSLRTYLDTYHDKNVMIMTDMPLGILPDGAAIYYHRYQNYTFLGFDQVTYYYLQKYTKEILPNITLLILQSQNLPPDIDAPLVYEVKRPGNEIPVWYVYKLKSISEIND